VRTVYVGDAPRLAVEVVDGPGPLLLFLHGVGGNRSNWRAQLAAFGERYRCAAMDARGYGDSGDHPEARLEFGVLADDAARVIEALGGGAAVVVGLSMGGRIALDLYARYPAQVRALVLADTSAGAPPDPAKLEAFMATRRRPLLEEGKTPADIAPSIVAAIAGPDIPAEAHDELIVSHGRLRAGTYLQTLDAVTRFADFPAWETIAVPTLVIVGEHDRIAPPAYAAEIAAAIPGARLVVIPRAGHVSNIEAPDAFNAALGAFLDELA